MLLDFSNQIADAVASAGSSVVQVQGRRRPASGVVHSSGVVVTTIRALGREDGLRVRSADDTTTDAELVGWDPATGLAVLKAEGLTAPPIKAGSARVRVGNLALALARSWSNGLTASAGIVSIIGGPLRTGRRRAINEVIRTTAPMHDGFAGGAFVDPAGMLIGITTASTIRGLGVVIPADIAWNTAKDLLQHGRMKRGYIGIAGQPARLAEGQTGDDRKEALLVVDVAAGGPAAQAGLLVGDLILALDGHPIGTPEDLLDLLAGDRVGKAATIRLLRGGAATDVSVTIGERRAS